MQLDLRELPVYWINLDKDTANASAMEAMLKEHGFKNSIRVPALRPSDIQPPPPSQFYGFACGMSHVSILEKHDELPYIVLEDDAKITADFKPVIDLPDTPVDAVYLGTSSGNPHYMASSINADYFRIGKVLSTHAILYLSTRFRRAVSSVTREMVYRYKQPVDIGVAHILENHMVLAPKMPYFVQADDRESNNKWGKITARPLQDRGSVFPPANGVAVSAQGIMVQ